MEIYEHRMRIHQHAKNIHKIMTRSGGDYVFKTNAVKFEHKSDNITTYLRKVTFLFMQC